jgi:hypothetical protein
MPGRRFRPHRCEQRSRNAVAAVADFGKHCSRGLYEPSSFYGETSTRWRRLRDPVATALGAVMLGHTKHDHSRPLALLTAMQRQLRKYVSPHLVHHCRFNCGRDRQIGHARAHDDLLDNHARNHWVDRWRGRHPHIFASGRRTLSSRRPYLFDTWRDPRSVHLLQAEDPFPARWIDSSFRGSSARNLPSPRNLIHSTWTVC